MSGYEEGGEYKTRKLTRDKWLSEEEYVALLEAAKARRHKNAPRDYALLLISGMAALRVSEAVDIRASDCYRLTNRPHPILRVRPRKKKKKVFYEVGIPVDVAEQFRKYVTETGVTENEKVFPIVTRTAQTIFRYYADRAGLNPKYSFHALRHFRGVHIYEKTRNLLAVKETLRHESISTSEVYLHAVELRERQVESSIPEIRSELGSEPGRRKE